MAVEQAAKIFVTPEANYQLVAPEAERISPKTGEPVDDDQLEGPSGEYLDLVYGTGLTGDTLGGYLQATDETPTTPLNWSCYVWKDVAYCGNRAIVGSSSTMG